MYLENIYCKILDAMGWWHDCSQPMQNINLSCYFFSSPFHRDKFPQISLFSQSISFIKDTKKKERKNRKIILNIKDLLTLKNIKNCNKYPRLWIFKKSIYFNDICWNIRIIYRSGKNTRSWRKLIKFNFVSFYFRKNFEELRQRLSTFIMNFIWSEI